MRKFLFGLAMLIASLSPTFAQDAASCTTVEQGKATLEQQVSGVQYEQYKGMSFDFLSKALISNGVTEPFKNGVNEIIVASFIGPNPQGMMVRIVSVVFIADNCIRFALPAIPGEVWDSFILSIGERKAGA